MAKAVDLADQDNSAKRIKTGGRKAKKSLDEMIADAERRSRLAVLSDDTAVEAELAAFYLIISVSQLRELRNSGLPSEEDKQAARLKKAADDAAKAAGRKPKPSDDQDAKPKGLRMIKIAEKGAIGSNQPVTYLMGDLRRFQKENAGYSTFEVKLASAGLLGWVSQPVPFFASPKTDRRGRHTLHCKGWGMDLPEMEKLCVAAHFGKLRCVWLTPVQAVHSIWLKESEHKKFAKPWLAILKGEVNEVKASIEATEIAAVASEKDPKKASKSL
ncbi:hypothetical protein [Rhodoferax aquaticus]|uniref:Uncharacterized protein n=1 Tax=Rhodoferax aquaticus TaxID=2527691 RepID=A0A515EQS1_9BURK|nr:hypothetical protein [Rhodoferax aquaticus]QDL55006.1 hypothetical protein EXZ61_12990 [Rhodoferax aquaticus]